MVGFAGNNKVNVQEYFELEEPLPEDGGYFFMSVKELDPMFAGQK